MQCVFFAPLQNTENALIREQIKSYSGVCLHNGIVYKDKDEWTVDSCTHCTCQVSLQLKLEQMSNLAFLFVVNSIRLKTIAVFDSVSGDRRQES